MNELALFAGAGGGILGGTLLGWRTVCAVECEPYAASVLAQRQNDGILTPFPIWDDVRTFDGKPWHGIVDVVSGGFPCQDISAAGRGAGIDGERSGLWSEMARIIGEVRPKFVFVENSPLLVGRGLVRVLADLAEMGFDAHWGVIGAADVGAPHRRDRCWIVAHATGEQHQGEPHAERRKTGAELFPNADSERGRPGAGREDWKEASDSSEAMADAGSHNEQSKFAASADAQERCRPQQRPVGSCRDGAGWWAVEPDVGRVANGVAAELDKP